MSDLYAFKRNVVLVASAGTGKTHALVGVILHALLGVSEPRISQLHARALKQLKEVLVAA